MTIVLLGLALIGAGFIAGSFYAWSLDAKLDRSRLDVLKLITEDEGDAEAVRFLCESLRSSPARIMRINRDLHTIAVYGIDPPRVDSDIGIIIRYSGEMPPAPIAYEQTSARFANWGPRFASKPSRVPVMILDSAKRLDGRRKR